MTPSRTDAQFIPILVAKALNHDKDSFLNILTGKGEIGTNTLKAAQGKYFTDKYPIPGYIKKNEDVVDTQIPGLLDNLKLEMLETRSVTGQVLDHRKTIENMLNKCKDDGVVPILHSVYGTATG